MLRILRSPPTNGGAAVGSLRRKRATDPTPAHRSQSCRQDASFNGLLASAPRRKKAYLFN